MGELWHVDRREEEAGRVGELVKARSERQRTARVGRSACEGEDVEKGGRRDVWRGRGNGNSFGGGADGKSW
jgi:hypothetical protein